MAFLTQNKAKFRKIFDHNIGILEKRQFFSPKLSKIAKNCEHNIEPWISYTYIDKYLFFKKPLLRRHQLECNYKYSAIIYG
jgi:hypothetical protein